MRRFCFLFCLVFFSSAAQAISPRLEGKVTVSKKLSAVSDQLRGGIVFDENNLPLMGTSGFWIQIPTWAAGTWHREVQVNILPDQKVTEESRTLDEDQVGHQKDRLGNIWHYYSFPYKQKIELADSIEWKVVLNEEPIIVSEKEIMTRIRLVSISVNKSDGKISETSQDEEIEDIFPAGAGKIHKIAHQTLFNQKGKAIGEADAEMDFSLIRPYQPIAVDRETGINLEQNLKDYLLSEGKDDLVP